MRPVSLIAGYGRTRVCNGRMKSSLFPFERTIDRAKSILPYRVKSMEVFPKVWKTSILLEKLSLVFERSPWVLRLDCDSTQVFRVSACDKSTLVRTCAQLMPENRIVSVSECQQSENSHSVDDAISLSLRRSDSLSTLSRTLASRVRESGDRSPVFSRTTVFNLFEPDNIFTLEAN